MMPEGSLPTPLATNSVEIEFLDPGTELIAPTSNLIASLSFAGSKELLVMTDGNLGDQVRKLEEASYIRLNREFAARRPTTFYSLTPAVRKALERHLNVLQALIGRIQKDDLK